MFCINQLYYSSSKHSLLIDLAQAYACIYINNGNIILKNEITTGKWLGVTYKEDLPFVKESIKNLIDNGVYNEDLWN